MKKITRNETGHNHDILLGHFSQEIFAYLGHISLKLQEEKSPNRSTRPKDIWTLHRRSNASDPVPFIVFSEDTVCLYYNGVEGGGAGVLGRK
jgi:hypothetical protein